MDENKGILQKEDPSGSEDEIEEEDNEDSIDASQMDLPAAYVPSKSLQALEFIDETQSTELFDSVLKNLKIISSTLDEDATKVIEGVVFECEGLKDMLIESRRQTKNLANRALTLDLEQSQAISRNKGLLKASQKDHTQIGTLKKELKKAWKSIETGREKDENSKEIIEGLKGDLATARLGTTMDLENMAESNSRNKVPTPQLIVEEQLRDIKASKAEVEISLSQARTDIRTLNEELEEFGTKAIILAKEMATADEETAALKENLAVRKAEYEREVKARERVEQSVRQTMDLVDRKDGELRSRYDEIKGLKEMVNKSESAVQGERARGEKMHNERDVMYTQQVRIQQQFDEQTLSMEALMNTNHEQTRKLKTLDEDITRLRENYGVIAKAKQGLTKKYKALDEDKVSSDMERDNLRSTNAHLLYDLDTTKREFEQASKNTDLITRERDISQKNFVKSTSSSLKQFGMLKLSEQNKRNLEQEISGFKDEAQKMRKLIFTLEKDRDQRLSDMNLLNHEVTGRDEEIKMKDGLIFDSKKKICDFEKRLKEQLILYESVRTDRNIYSKNLLESQDEIMEVERKLKILEHQVEQLKEEVASRENILVKECFEHSKMEKEKESVQLQAGKLQLQLDESHQLTQNQGNEESKLRRIIVESDGNRVDQKKELECVVQERDILGTHLIRRNDELSLLHEKIKIQTTTLNKGEMQYRERIEDIRVLRLEIKKLRREKTMLHSETQQSGGLKIEVFRLQKDILRERTRVKVLEEEMESSMNIHRWRKLAGSDPSTFELISKIQLLQKRLIVKTEEVVEKELVIQQKEALYGEIKKILQRTPGPEVMEELQMAKSSVKTKMRESKALASELNMYHSQVNEYKYEIERLNRSMQELKSKYYKLRRKSVQIDESVIISDKRGARFTGGGFNLGKFPMSIEQAI